MSFGRNGAGVLLIFGAMGLLIFAYLAFKYRSMIGLPGFFEVYDYRSEFGSIVEAWERYAIVVAKFVGAFSLAAYAICCRSLFGVAGAALILSVDYMLAGHKASIALLAFVVCAYYWFAVLSKRFVASHTLLVPMVTVVAVTLLMASPWMLYGLAVYERIFNVTAGLFVRYFEFADKYGFFYGGSGLLGALFGGVRENYNDIIGEAYFSEGVSANADLIADAYINFGYVGVFGSLFVLRCLCTQRDNRLLCEHRESVLVFIVPYMLALFSMGLQTALLTGGLAFALGVIKFATFPYARQHGIILRS